MKSILPFETWIRRALRVAVIVTVVAIALVWGTSLLTKFSFVKPFALTASAAEYRSTLPDEGPLPDLGGAIGWLNSDPLVRKSLRGKVVLADFWTYTCINSLRPLPYVNSWAAKYKDAGLVVIGVHTPEFSFEKERVNVENALRDLKVTCPVAIDSNYRIWQAFNNEYWRILASAIPHRWERTNSLSQLRGGRVWRIRARHPGTSERKRSHWPR